MRVDVVIDTVCPWCYVGKRRVEEGLALRPDINFEVLYHPFLLAPDMPREGKDRKQHYEEKFGKNNRLKEMTANLIAQAGSIDFQFDSIERVPNTVDSHRLIRWAQEHGRQDDVAEAVMKAYFTEGKDIGSADVLRDIATDAELDGDAFTALLANDDSRQVIEQLALRASGMGITGVPFFIFDGRIALSGAQDPSVIANAVDKALETEAA